MVAAVTSTSVGVALLAEGVDRNDLGFIETALDEWSPSSQRAWIEIRSDSYALPVRCVALLAEGVDRNMSAIALW